MSRAEIIRREMWVPEPGEEGDTSFQLGFEGPLAMAMG